MGSAAGGAALRGLAKDHGRFVSDGSWRWDTNFEPAFGAALASSAASMIASAATRSVIDGSNFGGNIIAGLPDVIGQALGGALGRVIVQKPDPDFDPKVVNGYRDQLAIVGEDGSLSYYSDGVAVYDELIDTRTFLPEVAYKIARDPDLVADILALRNMVDAGTSAVDPAGDEDNIINDVNGESLSRINTVDSSSARFLQTVNSLNGRIQQIKDDVHFNEIVLGIHVLMGPAAAAKSIAVALVGDAVIGDYLDQANDAVATAISSASLGMAYDKFDMVLGWDENFYSTIADEDQAKVRGLTDYYRELHGGAEAILGIVGSAIFGIRVRRGGDHGGGGRVDDSARYDAYWADLASRPGTLSNVNVRAWYKYQISQLPDKLWGSNLPLKEQARFAHDFRNEARARARDLMSDRALARDLDITDPHRSWSDIVSYTRGKGLAGDDLYREIIQSAGRSRSSIDENFGFYD